MRRPWVHVILGAWLWGCISMVAPVAHASETECVAANLGMVNAECIWSYEDYVAASTSDLEHEWYAVEMCEDPMVGSCAAQIHCVVNGQPGLRFYVFRDGQNLGLMCVPNNVEVDAGLGIDEVVAAFRSLSWPGSSLIVQPPGGRTLVNLDTFFYTSNFEPISKTVTLVGRQVEIVATPVSYRWVFGDGVVADTRGAGGPYPDGDVRHVYGQPGEMTARVATTYSGRYRIGRRAWRDIPETLTVPGEGVGLVVVEAKPQLVVR